ncbi:MAG: ComF family protein [Bacteroidales bacterium]|nr:ComF family protein [Bacteroidales bacterium]
MNLKERIQKGVRLWIISLASLFFRRKCICCQRELMAFESGICTFCLADMPSSYTWTSTDSPADKTFWGRTEIEKVTSLFLYNGKYRNLVYSLKYRQNTAIGIRLGKMLGDIIDEEDIDYILPVPLHPRKKRQRGYNQSEIICRGILSSLRKRIPGVKLETRLLKRKNFTNTQTRKDRIDRWKNVRNAFGVNAKRLEKLEAPLRPLHFLIVDDVLTTGATLDACATHLHNSCNCRISIATLAYVP